MPKIELAVEIIGETDQALRVYDGNVTAWIPKSQITDTCEVNGKIETIFIPEWIANDKGLL